MASFYGNMKNNSRSSFIFDKIYPSRARMEAALLQTEPETDPPRIIGDGVFVNRYVLVDYGYTLDEEDLANESINQNLSLYDLVTDNSVVTFETYFSYYNKDSNGNFVKAIDWQHPPYYSRKIFIDRFSSGYGLRKCRSDDVYDENEHYFLLNTRYSSNLEDYRYIDVTENLHNQEDTEAYFNANKTSYYIYEINDKVTENLIYHKHKLDDYDKYHEIYDRTAWMKIYVDGQERYIMVSQLDGPAPQLEAIADAPSCYHKEPHFDGRQSTDHEYIYHTPKNWDVVLNTFTPGTNYSSSTTNYYYYEWDKSTTSSRTYDTTHEYPYINKAGFDKRIQSKVEVGSGATFQEGIYLKPTNSGAKYPVHTFRHVQLTSDIYFPNRYYIAKQSTTISSKVIKRADEKFNIDFAYYTWNGEKFSYVPLRMDNTIDSWLPINYSHALTYYYDNIDVMSNFTKSTSKAFDPTAVYYDITWKSDHYNREVSIQNDTQRVDVYLPSIGTALSNIYDVLYGAPRIDNNLGTLIGYADRNLYRELMNQGGSGGYRSVSATPTFALSTTQINALSTEIYPGIYDYPIYQTNKQKLRPYTDTILKSQLAPPYNNIGNTDDASIGWSFTVLKRYISELRYLARGQDGGEIGEGIGLQSDWVLDDENAFGYIHNRPTIIYTFMPSTDTNRIDTEDYYVRQKNPTSGNYYFTYYKGNSTYLKNNWNTLKASGDIFKLPVIYGEMESNKHIEYNYVKVATNATYNSSKQYYFYENGVYVLAYGAEIHNELTVITDNDTLSENASCSLLGDYQLKTNTNNQIIERSYKIHSGNTLNDNIYLCYGQNFPLEFWLHIPRVGNDDPVILNDIDNLSNKTRAEVLNLFKDSNNNSYEITVLYRYEDIPQTINTSGVEGFYYARIDSDITNITKLNASNFKPNEKTYYTREKSLSTEVGQYEIHNIWARAIPDGGTF